MIILTTAEVLAKYRITADELARATRELNPVTGEIYYIVTSRSNGPDHTVRSGAHATRRVITCTCKAGQCGSTCWAMRAACAAAYAYRQEENLQARREAIEAAAKAAEASQARAYASDREWQATERAANRVPVRGYEARTFAVAPSGNRVPMR
jgi:hypothetical protein